MLRLRKSQTKTLDALEAFMEEKARQKKALHATRELKDITKWQTQLKNTTPTAITLQKMKKEIIEISDQYKKESKDSVFTHGMFETFLLKFSPSHRDGLSNLKTHLNFLATKAKENGGVIPITHPIIPKPLKPKARFLTSTLPPRHRRLGAIVEDIEEKKSAYNRRPN